MLLRPVTSTFAVLAVNVDAPCVTKGVGVCCVILCYTATATIALFWVDLALFAHHAVVVQADDCSELLA